MSINDNFHLHFSNKNQQFDIDFQLQKEPSSESVSINGKHYVLDGDKDTISWLKKVLPELTQSDMTMTELKNRLVEHGAINIEVSSRVESAANRLLAKSNLQQGDRWSEVLKATLPLKRDAVVAKYWEKNSERFTKIAQTMKTLAQLEKQHAPPSSKNSDQLDSYKKKLAKLQEPDKNFLGFLMAESITPSDVEKSFLSAVKNGDVTRLKELFTNLTEKQLLIIDHGENLNAILPVQLSQKPVIITESHAKDIESYMHDIGFSGAVTISDGVHSYTITSSKNLNPEAPFAIHSIGKVFTGALALRMIEENIISEKALGEVIQLNPDWIEDLSEAVREQLKTTTLRQVMLHQGRYGDYLGNYCNAIGEALTMSTLPPVINKSEDFLKFADKGLQTPDESGFAYSNLGLLLVGLSLQHLYNNQNLTTKTYDELLKEYVLQPAGVKIYENRKPDKARVDVHDKVSHHITGGPAGGAWTTVNDLARFGNWLGDQYKTNSYFSDLVKEFGGEFFADEEFSHGGDIPSTSAHLSHRTKNGVTLAVACDNEGSGAASHFAQTIKSFILSA